MLLKVYEWERSTWPEFQEVMLEPCEAEATLRKLVRHFKTRAIYMTFGNHRSGGGRYVAYWPIRMDEVRLTKRNINLGTVIHEFAHHLDTCRWRKRAGHGRTFKRELKRVYTWAKRYLPR